MTELDKETIDRATLHTGSREIETIHGRFEVHFFRDLGQETTAMAIVLGDITSSAHLLARVHSSCLTSECLLGSDCDCAPQLAGALAAIAEEGRGIIFYLMQEGRGAGLTAKAQDRMIVQASGGRMTTFEAYAALGLDADLRRYDVVAPMSRLLGIRAPLRLLTNNPEKAEAVSAALASEKIEVEACESIQGPNTPFNRDYLVAKHASGHQLEALSDTPGAEPPVPVRVFEPTPLSEIPDWGGSLSRGADEHRQSRLVTASYFLPVALADSRGASRVSWFRASVVYDRGSEREEVILSLPEVVPGAEPPSRPRVPLEAPRPEVITMRLFDRIPGWSSPRRERLETALRGVEAAGAGFVVIRFDDRAHAES